MTSGDLALALGHLRADQPGAALIHALAAWRALRAPALAALVDRIAVVVDLAMGPVRGATRSDAQRHWLEVAARRRPIDLGRLLAVLDDATLPNIRTRFELLRGFAPDPRLLPRMLPLAASYSYDAGPCFTIAFQLAAECGDPTVRAVLDALLAKELVPAPGDTSARAAYRERHARTALRVRDRLPASIEVPPAIEAQLAACLDACRGLGDATSGALVDETSLGPPPDAQLEALLAAVLDDPADDQARSVYADALLERGDPRGELIALQLRGGDPARERRLIAQHGRGWLAPLDLAIRWSSVRFARGFLDACRVEWRAPEQRDALAGHPAWATVRELECDDPVFVAHPVLRSLRRATAAPPVLARLARRGGPVLLEAAIGPLVSSHGLRLRTGVPAGLAEDWGAALDVGALVHLRALQLRAWTTGDEGMAEARRGYDLSPTGLAWLLASRLGAQLAELDLMANRTPIALAPWIERVAAHPLRVRLRFTNLDAWLHRIPVLVAIDLVRTGDQVAVEMTVDHELADLHRLSIGHQLQGTLEGMPHRAAPELVVRYTGSKPRTRTGFPAVAELLHSKFARVILD